MLPKVYHPSFPGSQGSLSPLWVDWRSPRPVFSKDWWKKDPSWAWWNGDIPRRRPGWLVIGRMDRWIVVKLNWLSRSWRVASNSFEVCMRKVRVVVKLNQTHTNYIIIYIIYIRFKRWWKDNRWVELCIYIFYTYMYIYTLLFVNNKRIPNKNHPIFWFHFSDNQHINRYQPTTKQRWLALWRRVRVGGWQHREFVSHQGNWQPLAVDWCL